MYKFDKRTLMELNTLLRAIEQALVGILEAYHLKEANIEQWQWDTPSITLQWLGEDQINRNIVVLIVQEKDAQGAPIQGHYLLAAEANAWQDTKKESKSKRLWTHEPLPRIPWSPEEMSDVVNQAYRLAANWTKDDLTRSAHIKTLDSSASDSGE